MIRPEDIFDAIGTLEDEAVFNAKVMRKTTKRKPRRTAFRLSLIAAVLVVIFSVSAGAVYLISHQKTVDLLETGIATGGAVPVELDEPAIEVIEEKSVNYNTVLTNEGTTVTLDSVMGFTSEDYTVCYITLDIAPPEGTQLTSGPEDWGFMESFLQPEDDNLTSSGGGSVTAIDNGDGTYSAMVMWQFYGSDLRDIPMKLLLRGFGNVSKEVARELYGGTREIEVPGEWVFHFEALPLDKTAPLEFDTTLFADEKIHPTKIELSSFGAIVTYTAESTDFIEKLGLIMSEKYPELEVDWPQMSLEQLNLLCAEGAAFTEEQQADIEAVLEEYGGMDSEALKAELTDYRLLYRDGTVCKIGSESPDFGFTNEAGESVAIICFDAPVDIDELATFEIGNVEIPVEMK